MNENQQIVQQKIKRRYQLLIALWEKAKGSELNEINFLQVARGEGFDEEEAAEHYSYFESEGFFRSGIFAWGICLSHQAIVEIENSFNNPQKSTEHFPSTVIQHFNAPVGAILNGSNNVANVNQNVGQNFSEILEQLAILRNQFQSLAIEEREEAIEVIDAIVVEVQSENPSKGKIKSFLLATKDFAVKTGTDLAASTLAKLLESQMGIKG
jgi:hypothetical protein